MPAHHCSAPATQRRGSLFCRDSLNSRGTQAPEQQPQDEEALLSMLLQKQAELRKMRAAIDELKTMDAGVTVRPRPPSPSLRPAGVLPCQAAPPALNLDPNPPP